MHEESPEERAHCVARSSTEFFLTEKFKSELYITPVGLLESVLEDDDNDGREEDNPADGWHDGSHSRTVLELPPNEIEARIEDFLNKFKYSGIGNLPPIDPCFDRDDQTSEGRSNHENKDDVCSTTRSMPNKKFVKLGIPRDAGTEDAGAGSTLESLHRWGRSKQGPWQGEGLFVKHPLGDKSHVVRQTNKKSLDEENSFDACNFRVSWISNESSTPSCPRQSITSPSDNNFYSSSLASSVVSQIEDEDAGERWSFDFPLDNLDYPDKKCSRPEDRQRSSLDSSCSRKFSNSSNCTSVLRILPRSGRVMGESDCKLTILDVANVLQNNFVFVSGGRSRRDFVIISFPECSHTSSVSDDQFKSVTSYLASILSPAEQESGLVVVIDRRQDKWNSVKTLLTQITSLFPTPVQKIYVLRPLGFLQKTISDKGLKFISEEFRVKILILDSTEVLHDYIDKDQLTIEFGGTLVFNLSEWIQHRAALEKFSANVALARQNMTSICQDLQEREFPNDVTQTEVLMHDHETIKVEIDEDLQSTLKHGKVLVECFLGRQEGEEGEGRCSEEELEALPKSKQVHVAAAKRLLTQMVEASRSFATFWDLHKVKLEQCLQLRKFEEDFKQLQYTCDKHLKHLDSLEAKCGSANEACTFMSELKKFEEESKNDITRAELLKFRGEKFIEENHYAVDCMTPKCVELERVVKTYYSSLESGFERATKSKELFDKLDNADRWCTKGVDFLASRAIETSHSTEEVARALGEADLLIEGFKELNISNPKEFHQKFNFLLIPELKANVQQILVRSDDVHGMLVKCRQQLASQTRGKLFQKPVRVVQPERPTNALQPTILFPPANLPAQNNVNCDNNNSLSPFSSSMINLTAATSNHVLQTPPGVQPDAQQDPDAPKAKRKFSLKKISNLERKFSRSSHNLDSIKLNRQSPNVEREENLRTKRNEAMIEILSAERKYVDSLRLVLQHYMNQMDSPELAPLLPVDLASKKRQLFSNWDDLLNFHFEVFLKELETAESMKSVEAFCFSFISHKDDLTKLYMKYSEKKSTSNELLNRVSNCDFMKECNKRAASTETLDVLLYKPIQQLHIYHRLLKELLKHCSHDVSFENVKEASSIVGILVRQSTDAMNLVLIEGFEGDLTAGGKLIQQGTFFVQVEGKSRGFLKGKSSSGRHILFYEMFIIICKKKSETNGNSQPAYLFKALLPTAELGLTENVRGDRKKFQLSLHKSSESYIVQAPSINVKDLWVSEIKRILLGQFEKIKGDNINMNILKSAGRSSLGALPPNGMWCSDNKDTLHNGDSNHNKNATSSSSSMTDLSKLPGQKYLVVANHMATRPDEVSLAMGTEVILVDPGEEGWSLIKEASNPKNEGWIPSKLLVEKKVPATASSVLAKDPHAWPHGNESLEQPV